MRTKQLRSLFPELSVDIQEAYRQHVRRVSNLFGRDVLLSSKPAFDRMEVSTITALGLPITCSVASHCVAYVG